MMAVSERPRMKCHKNRKIEGPPDGSCERKQLGADIKASQKNRFTIRSMKLESQRYGSLIESYHGNIRDRTGQKSKVKKERHDVNITVTNRELPSSSLLYRDVMMDIDLPEREFNPSDRCDLFLLFISRN